MNTVTTTQFKHLREGIMNAKIQVTEHTRVSVSYTSGPSRFMSVGSIDHYECAIEVTHNGLQWDLVQFKEYGFNGSNIVSGCDDARIEQLMEIARGIKAASIIDVFDTWQGGIVEWRTRFVCVNGYDREQKELYSNKVFDKFKIKEIVP